MAFVKATKTQSKLRAAIYGPSGAGKTYSGLSIATGIVSVVGGEIAVIDTERCSASKYSDRFDFDVSDMDGKKDIAAYITAISEVVAAKKYSALLIDSLSHAWTDLLADVDKIASEKFRGNTWSAWSKGTPKQAKLIDTLLSAPVHIIATMRSRTEWLEEKGDNGKVKPVKIGLAPIQGKNIEYEFDLLMEMDTEHRATVGKDRTSQFQDQTFVPDEAFGSKLAKWLLEGKAPIPANPVTSPESVGLPSVAQIAEMKSMVGGLEDDFIAKMWAWAKVENADDPWAAMTAKQIQTCIDRTKAKLSAAKTA